jgi:head-tail adaptor|tara:strand:- start:365 stop:703 length:339 start_codon:yes stop_codon:yes gene_type:complete
MAIQINSGDLKQGLYLQEAATPQHGNPAGWANVTSAALVRCKLTTTSGSEPTGQSGERGEAKLTMLCRYRSDITLAHRFNDGNSPARIFDIVNINNVDELNHKLLISLVEAI